MQQRTQNHLDSQHGCTEDKTAPDKMPSAFHLARYIYSKAGDPKNIAFTVLKKRPTGGTRYLKNSAEKAG